MEIEEIESFIGKVPDFPKPGILFYDISTLIYNNEATVDNKSTIIFGDYVSDYVQGDEKDIENFYNQITFINTRDHNSWEVDMSNFKIFNVKTKKHENL